MPIVFGFVRTEAGGPAIGATVRAFDKDLRHEQVLGEVIITESTGRYEITYTSRQFRRAEKKTADLIVRALDQQGNLRAESEIHFNASDNERIDLTFGPLPVIETPRLSELEQLQASIAPVQEDVAYRDFTDQDLTFLTEETIRAGPLGAAERRTVRQHLGFLRLADQFAQQTAIPLAAFYGWFREGHPQVLAELLAVPVRTLQAALVSAIRDRIIPDITAEIPAILERLRSLRFEHGLLLNHRFVVQFLNAATDRPVVGFRIAVTDPAADPEDRDEGVVFTDGQGACVIPFSLPADAPANATRRLHLQLSDAGNDVAEATIEARANQTEVAVVRLRLQENPLAHRPIEEVAPRGLVNRLHRHGIQTLVDLLDHPELTDDESPDDLDRLRAVAKFSILTPDLTEAQRTHLVSRGYQSPFEVANTSRAEFIRVNHEGLGGDASAAAVYFAAKQAQMVMVHFVGSAWIQNVTSPGDEPPDPDIPTGVNDVLNGLKQCGCQDCGSAVSPAAYLAHLLQWTLDHIKNGTQAITFPQLQAAFDQPFGDLPASCSAVEEQVRQVRICIEVLWRYTELLDRSELELSTPFRTAYRALRNQLYRAILANLGTSFEQLRRATLYITVNGLAAEQVAAQRKTVADILGIDDTHLDALFFNIDQSAGSPSEEMLQRRFGFKSTRVEDVFANVPTPDLAIWQRDRLESLWRSQDWPEDAYSGDSRRPFIDPALIDNLYLRTPLTDNAAVPLLDDRREALAVFRQSLIDQQPQDNGIVAMLEGALGQGIEALRSLYASLQADTPQVDVIAQGHATISSLNLAPAGFTRLMEVDAHLNAGEPLGRTQADIESAWNAVFDILTGARRRRLFSIWVTEENDADILFGPQLFWFPAEPPPPVNSWLAGPNERVEWEDALTRRSARPIIDPDQISDHSIILFARFAGRVLPASEQPPLTARQLWQDRRDWVDARLTVMGEARENLPTSLERLQATLSASTTGIGLDQLSELVTREASGVSLDRRLAQLNLTMTEYRLLTAIRELALANSSISADKWDELVAILAQVEKRREFADWNVAEQAAGILLHPHRFIAPPSPQPLGESGSHSWLHDPIALDAWVTTLHARRDQLSALRAGLAQAVSNAEETVLPLLRNILIDHAINDHDSLQEKADRLDKRLLIDMRMSGCQMTTRVSEAMTTLQRFIRAVYTQDLHSAMDGVEVDGEEDYLSAWPVLGSYATWRAFMLAYLYPENVLHLNQPPRQSYGFEQLKKQLSGRPTHEATCSEARAYGEYFRDVCNLTIQASCQIKTFVGEKEACEPTTATALSMLHLFARAQTSGRVYWATLDPSKDRTDTTTTWEPVLKLGIVEEIFGATPHFTPNGRRLVLLFFSVRKLGKMELRLAMYDVDDLHWSDDQFLALPSGGENGFSASVIQKRGADPDFESGDLGFPTLLAIKPTNGQIYINKLNQEAQDWESETSLFGPRMIDSFGEVLALIQRTSNEYLILAKRTESGPPINYRFLYLTGKGLDDITWNQAGISEAYSGGFAWFSNTVTFLFYTDAEQTVYQRLGASGPLKPAIESRFRYHHLVHVDETLSPDARRRNETRQIANDIVRFNEEWLERYVGVSLRDYIIPSFRPNFFVPHKDVEGAIDPLKPDRENIKESDKKDEFLFFGVSLSLLDVFSYELKGADIIIPDDARFRYKPLDLEFYQIQLQYQYVQEFLKFVANIDSAQLLKGDLGLWKFADQQIKRFSDEGLSLADLIKRFVDNIVNVYLPEYEGGIPSIRDTSFRERDTSNELSGSHTASSDEWIFVPTSGDEQAGGPDPRKAVVIQKRNDRCWWTRLRRQDDVLIGSKLLQLAPHGAGPFDILPQRDISALKQRRVDIESIWKPHRDQPPSVQVYLKEAYHLVPLYLAYELQRSRNYEGALLWYRQVYDYLQPAGVGRKVDYSLRLEEKLGYGYEDAEDWLNDTSDAHAIAATRKNTYTRHILLMIIRCLIEYADSLFAHDNVSDNARARELYTQALKLLELKDLNPGTSACANILGELNIDVTEGQKQQFKDALAQISNPNHLRSVVGSLTALNNGPTGNATDRFRTMRDAVITAIQAIPPQPRMTEVLKMQQTRNTTLENQFFAHQPTRMVLTKTNQRGREQRLTHLAEVTEHSVDELLRGTTGLPWLRSPAEKGEAADKPLDLVQFSRRGAGRLASVKQIKKVLPLTSLTAMRSNTFNIGSGISFLFCIPQNPVIQALKNRAENNLNKLRSCRNIAGFLRQIDPYGAPIGIGSGMVSPDGTIFSGIVDAPPTAYRYSALIARAKELVGIAQQIEAGYQVALVNAENEALTLLQAEQGVELARARVSLQDLRITQANTELGLAQLQRSSAVLRNETYTKWINAGPSDFENNMMQAYKDAGEAQKSAAIASATAKAANAAMALIPPTEDLKGIVLGTYIARAALGATAMAASIAEGAYNVKAIEAQTAAQANSALASFERRDQEWQLQEGLADLDVQIGNQQIALAQNQITIVQQERAIAGLEQTHAVDVLQFLLGKTFTEEMYRWIASVLEDVYRFFLQEATVIARLAERQLAFERQEGPLKLIQADYWNVAVDSSAAVSVKGNTDRLGLTGSARLLQDVYKLDNYAFNTRRSKQSLVLTLDLAAEFPFEFQRFRETGVLTFATPQRLIDQQMPGYYLCLIQQVTVSVVALIPSTYGIRATLTSSGLSRVVVAGDTFQTVTIRNLPERMALTQASTTSGAITLEPDSQSLLYPFEGTGFDTQWQLQMPKATNRFDYNSMATVLFTVNMTALHSFDYERDVISRLDRTVSFDRAFDFRQVFADAWYDLNNPDQTSTPMVVRFTTRRSDFPPNLSHLAIQQVMLYLVRKDGEVFEQPIRSLRFTPTGTNGAIGGPAATVHGRVSTLSGNGTNWLPLIGHPPEGTWELAFPDEPSDRSARDRFGNELIENMLLVLTVSGQRPPFPG